MSFSRDYLLFNREKCETRQVFIASALFHFYGSGMCDIAIYLHQKNFFFARFVEKMNEAARKCNNSKKMLTFSYTVCFLFIFSVIIINLLLLCLVDWLIFSLSSASFIIGRVKSER